MKIKQTSLFVAEQDKALSFYTQILGFKQKREIPEVKWLTVVSPDGPDDLELVLEPNYNQAIRDFQKAMFEQGIPVASFAVENMQEEFERLEKQGVEFSMKPTKTEETTVAVFNDTCGNLIELFEA